MGLRKDLEIKRKPSFEEARNILRDYSETDSYLKDLAKSYISYDTYSENYSTLLHIGRYIQGLSKKIVKLEQENKVPKQLSLFQ
jgi:hypothetical protein